MRESVCIADKSFPIASKLATLLIERSHSVAVLSPPGSDSLSELPWNRSSILSAETVSLDMKSRFGSFGQMVMCFDSSSISRRIVGTDRIALVQGIDEYVRGNALLLTSVVDFFRTQHSGRLVFAFVQSPSQSNPFSLAASLAESAFVRMAEEYATLCAENPEWAGLRTLLLKLDEQTEQEGLEQIVSWMESENPKNQGARWIKAGSRSIFGFRS